MKIKDIKSKLKSEHESAKIPDMLSRVKKAPINKLLSGETPAQAFQKKLAVRLLVTTTALLIVAVFCFAAMLLFTERGAIGERYYVSLCVQTEDGKTEYGIVTSEGLANVSCIDYQSGNKTSYRAIEAFYTLKSGDKVSIGVIGEDYAKCAELAKTLRDFLASAYGSFSQASVSTTVNDDGEITKLRERVAQRGGDGDASVKELVAQLDSLI